MPSLGLPQERFYGQFVLGVCPILCTRWTSVGTRHGDTHQSGHAHILEFEASESKAVNPEKRVKRTALACSMATLHVYTRSACQTRINALLKMTTPVTRITLQRSLQQVARIKANALT